MEQQTAKLNYLKIAPRKVRLVCDLIKGMPVNDAEAQLMLERRRPAKAILKLLRSAVANAKSNRKWNPDHLYVSGVSVNQGPMLKRYLPRARGSASPIQKKMSHVTIVLGLNANLVPKYKIVVPKKVKLPPSGDERIKALKKKTPKQRTFKNERPAEEPKMKKEGAEKKSGLLKKVFSSKRPTAK